MTTPRTRVVQLENVIGNRGGYYVTKTKSRCRGLGPIYGVWYYFMGVEYVHIDNVESIQEAKSLIRFMRKDGKYL